MKWILVDGKGTISKAAMWLPQMLQLVRTTAALAGMVERVVMVVVEAMEVDGMVGKVGVGVEAMEVDGMVERVVVGEAMEVDGMVERVVMEVDGKG
jgi:hypothetical protein